mmetsp:Transcript_30418/g.70036  ORF Transcript_30418/g.70036 Transcript_30418/m.70036 type:complete len:251 (-) Transcript_30418:96-848(-)
MEEEERTSIRTWFTQLVSQRLVEKVKGSLTEKEKLHPEQPEFFLGHLQILCRLYETFREYENARDTLLRIVDIQSSMGSPARERLNQQVRLGGIHVQLGDYSSAVESFRDARGIMAENAELQTELLQLEILDSLGDALAATGAHVEAEKVLSDAYALTRKRYCHNSIQVARSLQRLGKLRTSLGDHKSARDCLYAATAILEEFHPRKRSEIDAVQRDLALSIAASADPVEVLGGGDDHHLTHMYIVYNDS